MGCRLRHHARGLGPHVSLQALLQKLPYRPWRRCFALLSRKQPLFAKDAAVLCSKPSPTRKRGSAQAGIQTASCLRMDHIDYKVNMWVGAVCMAEDDALMLVPPELLQDRLRRPLTISSALVSQMAPVQRDVFDGSLDNAAAGVHTRFRLEQLGVALQSISSTALGTRSLARLSVSKLPALRFLHGRHRDEGIRRAHLMRRPASYGIEVPCPALLRQASECRATRSLGPAARRAQRC